MILRAKFVVPDSNTVIANGFVEINDSYITDVGRYCKTTHGRVTDLGEVVIMPGLVNAHCHLELSALHNKIKSGTSLPKWISSQMALEKIDWRKSVEKGLSLLARNGITSVGDICRRYFLIPILRANPIRKVVFYEVINTDSETSHHTIREVDTALQKGRSTDTFTPGVSPHAPYTASSKLYKLTKQLATKLKIPLATHIAETKEEVEFLQKGSGAFAKLLNDRNIPFPFDRAPALTPIGYLQKIGFLSRNVGLIHANYLIKNDISRIAKAGASVIFCPGSHKYFRHERHPISELIDEGVNVALGTDSLASNSDLSILREMEIVRREYKIDPHRIFEMATINGIRTLFRDKRLGIIRKHYLADLTCLALPHNIQMSDTFDFLCNNARNVVMTMVGGKIVYKI